MSTIRPRSFHRPSLLLAMGLVLAGCASSGGLGPVPSTPATPIPSAESNAPDATPAPSIAPSATAAGSASPGTSSSLPPASAGPTASPSTPTETMVIRAYHLLSAKDANGLVPTLRVVPKTTGVARAAMVALLDATAIHRSYPQVDTAIPDATTLLGISIKDGIATVDLSREFGAAAPSPVRVRGSANVFEATFRIAILDGAGKQLVDQQAMATCGTGCRGTFDTTVRYDVSKAQWGTLRVYFGSAVDGSPQDVRDYPVWLTPAG